MHDNIPDHLFNITEQVREPARMSWTNPILKGRREIGKLPTVDSVQAIETFRPLPYSCVGTVRKGSKKTSTNSAHKLQSCKFFDIFQNFMKNI